MFDIINCRDFHAKLKADFEDFVKEEDSARPALNCATSQSRAARVSCVVNVPLMFYTASFAGPSRKGQSRPEIEFVQQPHPGLMRQSAAAR